MSRKTSCGLQVAVASLLNNRDFKQTKVTIFAQNSPHAVTGSPTERPEDSSPLATSTPSTFPYVRAIEILAGGLFKTDIFPEDLYPRFTVLQWEVCHDEDSNVHETAVVPKQPNYHSVVRPGNKCTVMRGPLPHYHRNGIKQAAH
jgi:hypothetical protein